MCVFLSFNYVADVLLLGLRQSSVSSTTNMAARGFHTDTVPSSPDRLQAADTDKATPEENKTWDCLLHNSG